MSHLSTLRAAAALLTTLLVAPLISARGAFAQKLALASENSRSAKPNLSRAAVASWEGQLKGTAGAAVTGVVDRMGPADDPGDPAWPVDTHWRINSPESGRSLTAQLFGWVRDNGSMHLAGIITEGYKKGAEIHIDRRGAGIAVIRILPLRTPR